MAIPRPKPTTVQKVLAHGGCPDGTGALVVAKLYEKWFRPNNPIQTGYLFHGMDVPSIQGESVAVFDFSFNKEVTERLLSEAKEFAVFDHHEGQKPILEQFPNNCTFDNDKSGVRLAWDFFFGSYPPEWVHYIEDRDLWNWKYPGSRPFGSYIHYCVKNNSNPETLVALLEYVK